MRIFIMYDLAPGQTPEDFHEYARKVKIPAVRNFPSTIKYELYRVVGAREGKPPYQYVGVLDVKSKEAYEKQLGTPEHQKFIKDFAPRATKLLMMFAEKVE